MNSIRNHTVLVGLLDELDVATSHPDAKNKRRNEMGMMVELFEGTHPIIPLTGHMRTANFFS